MSTDRSRQVVVAGAGIAGLTAAIAFARKGFSVQVYEQAPQLDEVGAGLQVPPNATRLLTALGVTEHLMPAAVVPERIDLRDAVRQHRLASVRLGASAAARWKAPYLVAHRADLQSALLAQARRKPDIRIVTGARVADAALHARGATVSVDRNGRIDEVACLLLVGADGVHSSVRRLGGGTSAEQPSGYVAWRTTVLRDGRVGRSLAEAMPQDAVTAFLHPRFHLIAYPLRGGSSLNLVAVTRSGGDAADHAELAAAMHGAGGPLARLADDAAPWIPWPISTVDTAISWTGGTSVALIGDAAHAMTPFAAQGAAMAIEDAVALAELVAGLPDDRPAALAAYETLRRQRIKHVAARGRFNQRAYHAAGPMALGRDLVMHLRGDRMASDLDWLYGYDAQAEAASAAIRAGGGKARPGLNAGSG